MAEDSSDKSKRKFLAVAARYKWTHQSTIFFSDDGSHLEEVNSSRYISDILKPLKKHIRDHNKNIPVLVRLQFHLKDSKDRELPTKQQIIIVLYSPVPLELPLFNVRKRLYKEGVIKSKNVGVFTLNLKQRSIENQFYSKMMKIKSGKSHLHRINDFIYLDTELKQYTIINSSQLSNYERDEKLKF